MGKNKEHVTVKRTEVVIINIPPTTEILNHDIPIIVSKLLRDIDYNPDGFDFTVDVSTGLTTFGFYFFAEDAIRVHRFIEDLKRKFPEATRALSYGLLLDFDKLPSPRTELVYSKALAKIGDIVLYASVNKRIVVSYSKIKREESYFSNVCKLVKHEVDSVRRQIIPRFRELGYQNKSYVSPPYF